jgi:hypothetical protein
VGKHRGRSNQNRPVIERAISAAASVRGKRFAASVGRAASGEGNRIGDLRAEVEIMPGGRPRLDPKIKAAKRAAYLATNKERFSAVKRAWRIANKGYLNRLKSIAALEAKCEGIIAYGGKCQCCGEPRFEFLTIEHTEGRGAACYDGIENKIVRLSGMRLWQLLKRKGWPRTGYALLCFNCNCAKGAFGYCPHERERQAMQSNTEESEKGGAAQ